MGRFVFGGILHSCIFETTKDCHSEARLYRARNLLFRLLLKADSSPINPASE
jgi:hypothetical protein